ncbi:MAG: 30S ribosomal protein S4 [Candidatus Dependentiae bacterium]
MEKRTRPGAKTTTDKKKEVKKRARKVSEYGRQLEEKQKVRNMYGMREKQFKRFFGIAVRSKGAPGENLLSLLERRLDNVLYKLKLTTSRTQARQVIVHGHILVNNKKVYTPSFLVSVNDVVSLAPNVLEKKQFLEQVVDKRLNIGVKVPEWLELMKKERQGRVLRIPVRSDIQVPIEEHLIVELYSK